MFFDTKIAMLTRNLCRNKALWFLSDCELWDKVIKLVLTSYTRDLCLVSARILCCDRSFEILLSHKTFSLFSFSEDIENLLVIQTKYHSFLLFTFPSFWVVFLSFHCLKAFFFRQLLKQQLLKQATYQCQTYLDTMPTCAESLWNGHVMLEIWHSVYSSLLSEQALSLTESKYKCMANSLKDPFERCQGLLWKKGGLWEGRL